MSGIDDDDDDDDNGGVYAVVGYDMLGSTGILKFLAKNFYRIFYMVLFLLTFSLGLHVNLKNEMQSQLFRSLQELERCFDGMVWLIPSH